MKLFPNSARSFPLRPCVGVALDRPRRVQPRPSAMHATLVGRPPVQHVRRGKTFFGGIYRVSAICLAIFFVVIVLKTKKKEDRKEGRREGGRDLLYNSFEQEFGSI